MLVCSVTLRARRDIVADVKEAIIAVDGTASGEVIFATLVDDPASVRETLDAYLGETIVEPAAASDTITTGISYVAAVAEAVTALDVQGAVAVGAAVTRQAMVAGSVFVNASGKRQANANGVMINL